MRKKNSGFSLVEILVVISIISFLVSVAMVAVKNARDTALNNKINYDITKYRQAITSYAQEMLDQKKKGLPYRTDVALSTQAWCLGNYKDDWCWRQIPVTYPKGNIWESWALNAVFRKYIPSLPASETVLGNNSSGGWQGYIYNCVDISTGVCLSAKIRYFLKGKNKACVAGSVVTPDLYGDTYCDLTLSFDNL